MAKGGRTVYPSFTGYSSAASGGLLESADVFLRLVDSRIETGEERMQHSLSKAKADLLSLINARASKTDVWGAGATFGAIILGTFLAVLAWGGDRFDGGIQLQGSITESMVKVNEGIASNKKLIEEIAAQTASREQEFSEILRILAARAEPDVQTEDNQN